MLNNIRMQKAIKKYIGTHTSGFCGSNFILLEYAGNEENIIKTVLLEKLIEKHFNVYDRSSYSNIRELRYI